VATPDPPGLAVLAERIAHERELRDAQQASFEYERELRSVQDDHERELRIQTEAAVEKARQLQFEVYEARLEVLNHAAERMDALSKTFMPIDRFEREHTGLRERYEREHQALIERHTRDIAALAVKVEEQEKVTARQDATADRLDKLGITQRWMVGIFITLAIFGGTTLLHIWNII
jgi:hypothetical protein